MRILGDPNAADDVVQETFLSAYNSLPQLRDPNAARGWLARIAVRHARRQLRIRKLRKLVGLERLLDHRAIAKGATPEQQAMLRRIYEHLEQLPANQRIAWTLRYLEGERLESVAELCGCSLATAKRRIRAAHDSIQSLLGL